MSTSLLEIEDIEGTRPADEDDLDAIHNDDWRDAIDLDDFSVFEGSLSLTGSLAVAEKSLLVKGDLTLTGRVSIDETGSLIVTGTLNCADLVCEGNLEVQGDTNVTETIVGYYEAGISFFEGAIRAKVLLQGNHGFELEPEQLEVAHHFCFDNYTGLSKGTKEEVYATLSEDALTAVGNLMGITSTEDTKTVFDVFNDGGFLRR